MPTIKIDNKSINIVEGTSILSAARSAGIEIPSMCFLDGCSNHPSCMVCMVKNKRNGQMIPSCATLAIDGMDLASEDVEVKEARKEAIELLLSDHVGDCEAPCRIACPAFMDIPKMNRLISAGNFQKALEIVKQEIALPGILGHICSAPCEKVCRRKDVDQPVSICLLKRFTDEETGIGYLPIKKKNKGNNIAIVGGGPAGLSAAYHLLIEGFSCEIFERNQKLGGSLQTAVDRNELPMHILERELKILEKLGLKYHVNQEISQDKFVKLRSDFDAIILANGKNGEVFGLQTSKTGLQVDASSYTSSVKGVFACGSIIREQKMAVKAIAMGKEAAFSLVTYLKPGEATLQPPKFNSRFGTLRKEEWEEYLKESVRGERVQAKSPQGFNREEAMKEAARCLHCDCRKVDNCKLRECADQHQADRRKFALGDRNSVRKYMQHDLVIYEPEKCIKCGLCIEIAAKEGEKTGLTNIGRGFTMKVAIPFDQELNQALKLAAEACAHACPTGAISLK